MVKGPDIWIIQFLANIPHFDNSVSKILLFQLKVELICFQQSNDKTNFQMRVSNLVHSDNIIGFACELSMQNNKNIKVSRRHTTQWVSKFFWRSILTKLHQCVQKICLKKYHSSMVQPNYFSKKIWQSVSVFHGQNSPAYLIHTSKKNW